jgi:hypothetical protein
MPGRAAVQIISLAIKMAAAIASEAGADFGELRENQHTFAFGQASASMSSSRSSLCERSALNALSY